MFTERLEEERDAMEIAEHNRKKFIDEITDQLEPFQAKLDNMGPNDFVLAIIHDTSKHAQVIRKLFVVTNESIPQAKERKIYTTDSGGDGGGLNWADGLFFDEIGMQITYSHMNKKWKVLQFKQIVAIVPEDKVEECIKNEYHKM